MVEELLVGEQLTSDMIKSGEQLIQTLDKLNLLVSGAFWLLLPDERVWRLVVATPEARLIGPKAVYRKIQSALARFPVTVKPLGVKDISVVDNKMPLFSLIRGAIATGPGISGIRFSRNVINGQLIEDAYIYRAT